MFVMAVAGMFAFAACGTKTVEEPAVEETATEVVEEATEEAAACCEEAAECAEEVATEAAAQ